MKTQSRASARDCSASPRSCILSSTLPITLLLPVFPSVSPDSYDGCPDVSEALFCLDDNYIYVNINRPGFNNLSAALKRSLTSSFPLPKVVLGLTGLSGWVPADSWPVRDDMLKNEGLSIYSSMF